MSVEGESSGRLGLQAAYSRPVSAGPDPDTVSTYEAMAADYTAELEESAFNALYERPGVIALLPEVAGKRVLDVGCGSGPLSEWLVRHGAEVVGFDSSPSMVKAARTRRLSNASFRVADLAQPLTFLADSTFDLVVASLVMHYLRDWVPPLRELRRVLTDDGVLVFSTHHPASDIELSATGNYLATELLHDRWEKGGREYEVSFWRRPLSAMFESFDAAGFRVQTLSEPQPLPECEQRFPDAWKRLTTQPQFAFFKLRPHP
jgi:SAM-dependent methyltransferase